MNTEIEKPLTRGEKATKAALITTVSLLLPIIGGGIAGYIGAKEYEKDTGRHTSRAGYTILGALALGFFNPYTFDVLNDR